MSSTLAARLRSLGFDTAVPSEIGMERATDEAHRLRAARGHRVLITHDVEDFGPIAETWFRRGRSHSGILFAQQPPQLPFDEFVRRVLTMLDRYTAEEFADQVIWL